MYDSKNKIKARLGLRQYEAVYEGKKKKAVRLKGMPAHNNGRYEMF